MGKKRKYIKEVEEEVIDDSEETDSSPRLDLEALFGSAADEDEGPKIRTISLYGEVTEEIAAEIVYSLHIINQLRLTERQELSDPEDIDSELVTVNDPLELLISTHGGSAPEMFAIYDMIRLTRKQTDVCTIGIGKVMSAGVLLLASGTKGQRKIAKNCRVMIHSVIAASHGSIHSLEAEMDEIRYLQERHIDCLVEETDMTKRYLKKLMDKKVNVYLTAEEAVDLGIADEII